MVTEQCLIDTVSIIAGIRGIIAFLLSTGAAWVLGCFVRLVMAVKVSITLPGTLDEATSIGTAEFVGFACWIFALLGLIRAIAAVVVMVAHKVSGDTLLVLAHELVAAARVVKHTASFDILISSLRTVFVPVTFPSLGDTHM